MKNFLLPWQCVLSEQLSVKFNVPERHVLNDLNHSQIAMVIKTKDGFLWVLMETGSIGKESTLKEAKEMVENLLLEEGREFINPKLAIFS